MLLLYMTAQQGVSLLTPQVWSPTVKQDLLCTPAGGKLVIINLQKTPKDRKADLVIHAKCDDIMQQIMTRLELPIPPYKRQDSVVVSHTIKPAKARNSDLVRCSLSVQSVHGPLCALPLVKEVEIAFEVL